MIIYQNNIDMTSLYSIINPRQLILLIGIPIAIMLAGCSPKTVGIPVEHTVIRADTIFKTVHSSDTIRDIDTIRISPEQTEIIRWRIRDRQVHDTVFRSHIDTVFVDRPIYIGEKSKASSSWWKYVMNYKLWLTIIIIVFIISLIRRRFFRS